MDRSEFLERLNAVIKDLPKDEKEEINADYEEYFSSGAEDGRSESEISASLGDPDKIGRELISASLVETAGRTGSFPALCRAALAITGLGLFNFIIALAPIIVAAIIILAILICGLGFIFGGVMAIVSLIAPPILPAGISVNLPTDSTLVRIAISIGLIVSGTLLSAGSFYLAKFFVRAIARYFRMNLSVVRKAYGNEK